MEKSDSHSLTPAFLGKYWEILSLIGLTIFYFVNELSSSQMNYSLLYASAYIPFLLQVLSKDVKNIGLILYNGSLLVLNALQIFENTYKNLYFMAPFLIYLTLHLAALIIMTCKKYIFSSEKTLIPDAKLTSGLLVGYLLIQALTGKYYLRNFQANRLLIELFLTVVLLCSKNYTNVSILQLGMSLLAKFMVLNIKNRSYNLQFNSIIDYIIFIQIVNFLLAIIYKYGIIRVNLCGWVNEDKPKQEQPIKKKPIKEQPIKEQPIKDEDQDKKSLRDQPIEQEPAIQNSGKKKSGKNKKKKNKNE